MSRQKVHPKVTEGRLRFGLRLRTEREAAEMSQLMLSVVASELVTGVGGRIVIKEHLIRCAETGIMSIPTEFLPPLAAALGVSVSRLLGLADPVPTLMTPAMAEAAVTNTNNRRAA